jgi:preprotein translocase subunit SecD
VREFDDINFTFVVFSRAVKQPTDTLYEVLEINDVNANEFAAFENSLQSTTRYTIQDIFVQNTEAWVPALDPKTNRVLNGTYFSMASVGSSQLGKPVVLVQFDSQGQDIFCSITDSNIGNQMAIFVGGELITSPVIQDRICGGTAQIDGDFTGE